MNILSFLSTFDWGCKRSWKISSINTFWCLLGCFIGDNSAILMFQWFAPHIHMAIVMPCAALMGLLTSIALETFILSKQMAVKNAIKVALGMSIISMLMMETVANLMSIGFAGGNRLLLLWWSIVPSWIMGYLVAWVYNYYKIKKYGQYCH